MVVKLIEKMNSLGFSEYESRAYISLLENSPVSAYELSKQSGIPSSKIYELLGRLADKGLAIELTKLKKKCYIPVDPDEFLKNYSSRIEKSVDELTSGFAVLSRSENISYILQINSYDELLGKVLQMIKSAGSSLLISGWSPELVLVKDAVIASSANKALIHFGEVTCDLESLLVYEHPVKEQLFIEKGGRSFVLCIDQSEAVSATIFDDGTVEAAWSRNHGFVAMAEDYMRHDIYILKVVKHFEMQMRASFGDEYHLLRNIFKDEVQV